MKKGPLLFRQRPLWIVASGSLIFILLECLIFAALIRRYLQHYDQLLYGRVASELAQEIYRRPGDERNLRELFLEFQSINPSLEAFLLDATGSVIAATDRDLLGASLALEPVLAMQSATSVSRFLCGGYPSRDQRDGIFSECHAFSSLRLEKNGMPAFLYLVSKKHSSNLARFLQSILPLLLPLSLCLGGMVVLLLLALTKTRQVMRHELEHLGLGLEALLRGGIPTLWTSRLGGEMAELANNFQCISDSEGKRQRELQSFAERRREALFGLMHDLLKPLSILQFVIERVGKSKTEEEQNQLLGRCFEAVASQEQLLQQLAPLAGNNHPYGNNREVLSLHELLSSIVRQFQVPAEEKQISLGFECTNDLAPAKVNRLEFARVLRNLLDNAIQYTPSGGRVLVRATEDSAEFRISVEDSGIGFLPDERRHFAETLYRSPRAKSSNPKGVGVGLFLARQILEAHFGRLQLETSPFGGACIQCILPKADPIMAATVAESKPPSKAEAVPSRFSTLVGALFALILPLLLLFCDEMSIWTLLIVVAQSFLLAIGVFERVKPERSRPQAMGILFCAFGALVAIHLRRLYPLEIFLAAIGALGGFLLKRDASASSRARLDRRGETLLLVAFGTGLTAFSFILSGLGELSMFENYGSAEPAARKEIEQRLIRELSEKGSTDALPFILERAVQYGFWNPAHDILLSWNTQSCAGSPWILRGYDAELSLRNCPLRSVTPEVVVNFPSDYSRFVARKSRQEYFVYFLLLSTVFELIMVRLISGWAFGTISRRLHSLANLLLEAPLRILGRGESTDAVDRLELHISSLSENWENGRRQVAEIESKTARLMQQILPFLEQRNGELSAHISRLRVEYTMAENEALKRLLNGMRNFLELNLETFFPAPESEGHFTSCPDK